MSMIMDDMLKKHGLSTEQDDIYIDECNENENVKYASRDRTIEQLQHCIDVLRDENNLCIDINMKINITTVKKDGIIQNTKVRKRRSIL